MKKRVLAAILACVGIGVIAVVAVRRVQNPFADIRPTIVQSHGPVSAEEARRQCPIAIPSTAKNVQYAVYSEFQAFAAFVRYEAPVDACIEAGKTLLGADNAERRKNRRPELEGLHALIRAPAGPQAVPGRPGNRAMPPELSIPWFNPGSITEGLEGGGAGSHEPKVWIDTTRGVFYYQLQD